MAGVTHQLAAIEHLAEQLFAKVDRARLIRLIEAVRLEDVLRRLDDERRSAVVEPVDVGLEPAVLGAAKVERECVITTWWSQARRSGSAA